MDLNIEVSVLTKTKTRSIEWGLLPGNSDQPGLPLISLAFLHSN